MPYNYNHYNKRYQKNANEKFRSPHPEICFKTVHLTENSGEEFDIIVTDKELSLPYQKPRRRKKIYPLLNKDIFYKYYFCQRLSFFLRTR